MKEHKICSGMEKQSALDAPSSTLDFKGWTSYFKHRNSIDFSKNKMDSVVIKSHQCSQGRSHAASIELNSEF